MIYADLALSMINWRCLFARHLNYAHNLKIYENSRALFWINHLRTTRMRFCKMIFRDFDRSSIFESFWPHFSVLDKKKTWKTHPLKHDQSNKTYPSLIGVALTRHRPTPGLKNPKQRNPKKESDIARIYRLRKKALRI